MELWSHCNFRNSGVRYSIALEINMFFIPPVIPLYESEATIFNCCVCPMYSNMGFTREIGINIIYKVRCTWSQNSIQHWSLSAHMFEKTSWRYMHCDQNGGKVPTGPPGFTSDICISCGTCQPLLLSNKFHWHKLPFCYVTILWIYKTTKLWKCCQENSVNAFRNFDRRDTNIVFLITWYLLVQYIKIHTLHGWIYIWGILLSFLINESTSDRKISMDVWTYIKEVLWKPW